MYILFPCTNRSILHSGRWTLIFFFGHGSQHVGCYFPDLGRNHHTLHLKCGVLTTGPPGKSLGLDFSHNYFFQDFFKCEPFLKSLLNVLQHCFCFMSFGFFGHEAWGILTAWPGVKPTLPALEGEDLTTVLLGNFIPWILI